MKGGALVVGLVAGVVAAFLGLLVVAGSVGGSTEGCDIGDGARFVATLTGRQLANAKAIVDTGTVMEVPPEGQQVAMATALQESGLRVLANPTVPASLQLPHDDVGADHDSVGLYQQRGRGWGPLAVRMDPGGSARLFYEHLLAVPGWERLPLTVAADRVQRSAFPQAYAQWEERAHAVVAAVSGICTAQATRAATQAMAVAAADRGTSANQDDAVAASVIRRALTQLGVPYVWGGGDARGPTAGGFDCSGLMVYAFAGSGVKVPHQTQVIFDSFGPPVRDPLAVRPGDMVLFGPVGSTDTVDHVGLYLGEGRMVHAPQTGETVTVASGLWTLGGYWRVRFVGAVRAR